MRTDALFERYEVYVAAASIAAHASIPATGFRQRDVRFFIELFTNWVNWALNDELLVLSNTQVARYLDKLVEEGFARRMLRNSQPQYHLTRTGLIELVSTIVKQSQSIQPTHFCFRYYFIKSYKPRLFELIEKEGTRFPLALRLELEGLLDEKAIVKGQIKVLERERKKLDSRIYEALQSAVLAKKRFAEAKKIDAVAAEIEKLYPYELNSQKPLSELLSGIPAELARWELETGNTLRANLLWAPARALFDTYLESLRKFL